MTRDEVTARLCSLLTRVNAEITEYREPADCICSSGASASLGVPYQCSHTAVEFLESAVFAALANRKA